VVLGRKIIGTSFIIIVEPITNQSSQPIGEILKIRKNLKLGKGWYWGGKL